MSLPGYPTRSFDEVNQALQELQKAQVVFCTNASKPDVVQYEGRFIYVKDALVGLRMQYSDGTNWNSI